MKKKRERDGFLGKIGLWLGFLVCFCVAHLDQVKWRVFKGDKLALSPHELFINYFVQMRLGLGLISFAAKFSNILC